MAPMAWLCPRRGTERRYTISKMLPLVLAAALAMHEIAAAVERMLQTDVLVIENEQEVFTAMIRSFSIRW